MHVLVCDEPWQPPGVLQTQWQCEGETITYDLSEIPTVEQAIDAAVVIAVAICFCLGWVAGQQR